MVAALVILGSVLVAFFFVSSSSAARMGCLLSPFFPIRNENLVTGFVGQSGTGLKLRHGNTGCQKRGEEMRGKRFKMLTGWVCSYMFCCPYNTEGSQEGQGSGQPFLPGKLKR